jgi:glutaredoxin
MTNYKLFVYSLEGCGYSKACLDTLNNLNIEYQVIRVSYDEKEKYKIPNVIETYPQIYLKKNNTKGSLLLGGYSDLKNIIDTFINSPYDENKINNFILNTKLNGWNKKALLRLIELLISK